MTNTVHVTPAQWRKVHPDFKTTIDGKPFMLRLNATTQATELVPVTITNARGGI